MKVKRGDMISVDIIEEKDPYKQILKFVAVIMAFVFFIIGIEVLKILWVRGLGLNSNVISQ